MRENKAGKYFKYAIGEIVLVVIGILIALSINNWNEAKNKEKKFERLLLNAQKELQENIAVIDSNTPAYMRTDSLVYLFQNKLVNQENFDHENINFLGYGRLKTSIQNDAYNNLIGLDFERNKSQDSIIELLKAIYVRKNLADDYFDYLGELISSELLSLSKTKGWYNEFMSGKINKEISKYFLTDSLYANYVAHYSNYYFYNYIHQIQAIRSNSSKTKKQILNYFNEKDTLLDYKIDDYDHYIGIYKDSVYTVKIESKDDKLVYTSFYNGEERIWEYEIYPVSQTLFTTSNNDGFYYLILDDNKQVIGHRWSFGITSEDYLKVD